MTFTSICICLIAIVSFHYIYGHIPEDAPNVVVKKIENYKMLFLPYPKEPIPNDDPAKLNFNVQKDNIDVYGLFVSIIIKDKKLGSIVHQIPYKFYPIGDIFIDHVFTNSSEYEIFLLAKINNDPKYQTNPLMGKFDISVREQNKGLLASTFDFFKNPS
jgi:hypothetical protein